MAKKVQLPHIRPFKESKEDYWVGYTHYRVVKGEVVFIAGGIESEEAKQELRNFINQK
jgi:fructose-bisphosphate aldolase class 1